MELILSKRGDNGSFGDILSNHENVVVALNKVILGEYTHPSEVSREILYVRYWVPIRHCGIIEVPVVSARTPPSRGFWYHV